MVDMILPPLLVNVSLNAVVYDVAEDQCPAKNTYITAKIRQSLLVLSMLPSRQDSDDYDVYTMRD